MPVRPGEVTDITVIADPLAEEQLATGAEREACLVVLVGHQIGKRYFLHTGEYLIGRTSNATIFIDEDSVSRNHAKIGQRGGRFYLQDLGSTNGTLVNEERIIEVELKDGDLIRIGRSIFKYLTGSNIENKYHEEIYQLTTMDGLTRIYNRRYFRETLERELGRAKRYKRVLSLVLFDIDHFKYINDTYGHLAGDNILRELSALLAESLRREDIFARYGGEEFAIILPEINTDAALVVCEKLKRLVASKNFFYEDQPIQVTISLGISTFFPGLELTESERELTVEQFIAKADAKLYEAKQKGRNMVCA